tara:strand:+ start:10524 stop:10853 length:330 start_codon:yes stop_codon:yes gene_type:complete
MKKLLLVLMTTFVMANCYSQVTIKHFNATWNATNKVTWLGKLSDCSVKYIDVAKYPTYQKKYKLVVFPTIIVFNDGSEIKRYQADLSFKITATKEEIQELIDESIMSGF